MSAAQSHHLTVARTARYHTLGGASAALRQVWFVLHGHAQLSEYFIRHFAPLEDGTRLIVAPEGLNRFYLETSGFHGGASRVGATWMTREDRLAEIADYVGYLDRLYAHVMAAVDRAMVRVVVLGFSQGVATACRWLCQGQASADTLICWAGPLAAELDADSGARLRALRVLRVIGTDDPIATPDALAAEEARARTIGLSGELRRFAGGHQLDAGVLKSLDV